ncbi:restriction endonuclease subunit S [Aeromonas sp. 96A]|uniref:restriction endonuclease subunit S n=1 Tax=Aeromonas sp. 96A TaxID=3452730 RepID=UPI003F790186
MVPKGWSQKLISDVGAVVTGNTPPTSNPEYYNGKYPFVSPADLGAHKLINSSIKSLSSQGMEKARSVRAGATLFTCIGSTIGKIGLAGCTLATNQQINVVIPKPDYDDDYVYYQLELRAAYIAKLAGTQAVPIINKTTFESQCILVPDSLPEQKKIAQILSTWDKAITTTEQLLANSQQQKKALMQKLLTGQKRLLDNNGVRFSGEWKAQRIGSLLKEVKRPVQWDDDSEYHLLSVKRRSEGVVLREILKGSDILTKKMNTALAGDFLISKMQVVHGATGLVTEEFNKCHISDSYIALRPKDDEKIDIAFFSWFSKQKIMYHKAFLCSYGVHIEKMTFNFNMFVKEKVIIPATLEEQQKIAAVLSTADQEITALQQKLDALKQEKKALMQQLLTGKRRVKVEEVA